MTVGDYSAREWCRILVLLAAVLSLLIRPAPARAQDFVLQPSGRLSLQQVDQFLPTPRGALPISRTYTADIGVGSLGPGWMLDAVSSLDSPVEGLLAVAESGHTVILTRKKDDPAYDGPGGVRVYRKGEGWVSEAPGGAASTYDQQGRETARRDAHGSTITFFYDAAGRLAKILSTNEHFLILRWGPNHLLEAMEGPGGRRAAYRYDPAGRLIEASDLDGWKTSYSYTEEGRLAEIRYPSGEVVGFRYDSTGRVTGRTSSTGPSLAFSYGEANRVTREDGFWWEVRYDPQGHAVSYRDSSNREQGWTRDVAGRLTASRFPDGSSAAYAYDNLGRLVKQETNRGDILKLVYDGNSSRPLAVDRNGLATLFNYDAFGDVLSVTSPAGRKIAFGYDKQGRRTSVTDGEGRTVRFEYDQGGNLTKQINPDKGAASWVYDDRGNYLESRDPAGRITQYAYDNHRQLISVTEPGGIRTAYTYDFYGRLTSETEGAKTISYIYDQKGRLTRIDYPDASSATLAYDLLGNPVTFTDELGRTTRRELDAHGRQVKLTLPTGVSANRVFDPSGRAVTVSLGKSVTRLMADDGGRVIRVIEPSGGETRLTLGKLGEVLEQVLPGGGVERRTYDGDGLLQSVTLPQGDAWRFAFDRGGELGEIGFPDGSLQKRSYDQAGNLSAVLLPWGGKVQYRYDLSGLLVEKVNARGEKIRYTYDAAGNLVGRQTPTEKWNFQYDSQGNLLQAGNGSFTVRHTYDNLSRLVETEYPEWRKLLRYQYDAHGRIVSRTEPGGRQTRYAYDDLGRVSQLTNERNEAVTLAYDEYDRLTSRTAVNGTTTLYAYDDGGRTTAIEHRNSAGTVIAARHYGYDVAGNPTEVIDEQGRKTTHRYDSEGRLISEQGPALDKTYLYGPGGNRSAAGEASGSTPYRYDKAGRLVQAGETSFAYDADGNLISRTDKIGTTRYAYDSENRLVRVQPPGGKVVSYGYGPFGERISRKDGSQITYYLLDGNGILQELSGDYTTRAAYVYAGLDQPLLMNRQDGSSCTFHQDALGTVLAVSDPKGEILGRYAYDAFGNVLQQEGKGFDQPLRFTGRPMDPETRLYDLRARFYDPKTGRFITRDPAGGTPERPPTYAPYLYANNNPLKYVDPFGTDFYLRSEGRVEWVPENDNEVGRDPDALLRQRFERPANAFHGSKGMTGNEYIRERARRFRHYAEIFRRTMGEEAAEDWRRRALPVWDRIIKNENTANPSNPPLWQELRQKLVPRVAAENAALTTRVRVSPGGAADAPQAADPLGITRRVPTQGAGGGGGGSLWSRIRGMGASLGNKLRGMAGLLGLSGSAQAGADWLGENFDIGTGQWSDNAAQDLKDRAARYLSSSTALTAAASTAVGHALAETTAGAVVSTGLAGAAAAGVGWFTVDRVSSMFDEAAGWRRSRAEEAANANRAALAESMICNRAKDIQQQHLRSSGELDRLRPDVQRAAEEVRNLYLEVGIANKKNVILSAVEKLETLLDEARGKADAIRALLPGTGADPVTQKLQALLEEIQDLKNRSCKIARDIAMVSDVDKRRRLTLEAQDCAGNADAKTKELAALIQAAADEPKPASPGLAELEDIVLQMEETNASIISDWERMGEWKGMIEKYHDSLQEAWKLQRQINDGARHLQNFKDCFDQEFLDKLQELRQRAEAPLPSLEQAAAAWESARTNCAEAADYCRDRVAWLGNARTLLAGLKNQQSPAAAGGTKNESLQKANALARQARECADAVKLAGTSPAAGATGDGFGPAGEGTTEESTPGDQFTASASGDGFGPAGSGQTTDETEALSLLGSGVGSDRGSPAPPGTTAPGRDARREPSWTPPLSRGDQIGARGQPVAPDAYRWYVMCNRTNGTVVFGKEWDPSRHVILAGPFEGPRTAQNWIGQNCPSARCTQMGACAGAPASGGSWYVLCNQDDGNVVMSKNVDPFRQIVWQSGFRGEWDARQWIAANCPSARCDRNGRCAQQGPDVAAPRKPTPLPDLRPPRSEPSAFCTEMHRRFLDALRSNQLRAANDILQAARSCWFYADGIKALQQVQSKPPAQTKPEPTPAPTPGPVVKPAPGTVVKPTPEPSRVTPQPTCNRRAKCESWDAKARRWVLSTGYGGGFGREYEVGGACQVPRQLRCWDECDKKWRCYETR